ncbi:hypothetical protein ACTJIJ_25040 [Niabella sp. 22666]|uniref:hypothetical protein n=1 Tax=Niabella sp. 22666 TaxID=3453954 RepID=UPI003F82DDBB
MKISQIKKDLQNGVINSSLQYLFSAVNISVFREFKEHKLLLIPPEAATLFEEYEKTARRIIPDQQELNKELRYLKFTEVYLLAIIDLKKQIKKLLDPYLKRSLKEFLFLIFQQVELYETQLTEHLYEAIKDESLNKMSSDQLSEIHEWSHNALRGRILDMMFAATSLINIFAEWQLDNTEEEFVGVNETKEIKELHDALMLSGNLNSYHFALDKISYGEWNVTEVGLLKNKPVFTFEFIDERFEKARDIGLKRETSDKLFVKKKNKRWLKDLLIDFASDAFDEAWDYYQNLGNIFLINNEEYRKGKAQMINSLETLDAEDELLVGMNPGKTEIISAYVVSCILGSYTIAAKYLTGKSPKHLYTFTCPEIPAQRVIQFIDRILVFGQPVINCLDLFICNLPLKQHLDLFKAPFIRNKDGKVYATDYLSEDWANWARSFLMRGGKTADIVGKSWEGYIADIMRSNHWQKVVQGIKIKKDGRLLTDIDILAKRDDVLLIVQMKIYYGTGINHYEQWKFRSKLEHAVKQVRISESSITENIGILKPYFSDTELNEIKRIQPVVMTNSHMYNGWKYDDVPIMSIGSLMQIINGASVKFERTDGIVMNVKKYAASDIVSADEFIGFLEYPLDWRIGDSEYQTKYHQEEFEHAILNFPLLVNKEGNNSIDLFMA